MNPSNYILVKPKPNTDIFSDCMSLDITYIQQHIIKKLYEQKYSILDISQIMGLSDRQIHRQLKLMGIKKKNGKERH